MTELIKICLIKAKFKKQVLEVLLWTPVSQTIKLAISLLLVDGIYKLNEDLFSPSR